MNWTDYFLSIAHTVAQKSKDRSTKVGCVIVGPDNEIRSTGYNGFPRGVNDDVEARHQRPEKYYWAEHAERNAIYAAARVGTPLAGSRAYSTLCPCMDCARALVQAGVVEVISPPPDHTLPVWGEQFPRVKELLKEANVRLRFYL